jgi:hypothetical protein
MKRYKVTIKNIAARMFWASVWLVNIATVIVGTYIIVHHRG